MNTRAAMIFIAGLAIGGFVNGVIVNSVRESETPRCDVLAYRLTLATADVLTGLGDYNQREAIDLMWSNGERAAQIAADLANGPLGENFNRAAAAHVGC